MSGNKILASLVILLVARAAVAGNSLADYQSGFYLGTQIGYARTDEGSWPENLVNDSYEAYQAPKTKEISKDKVGGRIFVGYSFSPYFSLETGGAYYPRNKYKVAGDGYDLVHNISNALATIVTVGLVPYEERYKKNIYFTTDFYTIDLLAKGILPLEHLSSALVGWSVYGKLGAAVSVVKYKYEEKYCYGCGEDIERKDVNVAVMPAYALGISYNFNDHIGLDLSWSGVYSANKLEGHAAKKFDASATPSANLVALGITYKI